jgi:hypothetical protein
MRETLLRLVPARFRPEKDLLAEALSKTLANPSHAPEFFKALLNQQLHAFMREGELVQYSDSSGGSFIPIFSRAKLLPSPPTGSKAVELRGREMLELARGKGRIVLNPGRKEFKAFGPEDIDRILDRLVSSRFQV